MLTATQKAIVVLTSFFEKFTMERAMAYDEFLKDIPAPVLDKAIKSLILTAKYPPTVAEIREEAVKICAAAKGARKPDAGAAWERARRGMSRWGSGRLADFLAELESEGDGLTAEAVKRFGWQEFGLIPPEGMNTARAQFVRFYNELAAHKKEERRITSLIADGRVQALLADVAGRRALPQ